LGEHVFEYGVSLFPENLENIPLFRMAEEFHQPLCSTAIQTNRGVSTRTFCESFFSIDNPRIVLSALKTRGHLLLLRVYNPYDGMEAFTVEIALFLSRISRVSLDGKEQKAVTITREGRGFSDSLAPYSLATYEIVGYRL
jgi:alpha-mannosidase